MTAQNRNLIVRLLNEVRFHQEEHYCTEDECEMCALVEETKEFLSANPIGDLPTTHNEEK